MSALSHAYTGAVAYYLLSRAIGVDGGAAAPVLGAILGSAPDTFDWIGWKLGYWPRWWLYSIMHKFWLAVVVEVALIAPGLHLLFDLLIHPPVLPKPGQSDDYDYVLFRLFGKPIARRDIHWCVGEAFLITLTTLAWIRL